MMEQARDNVVNLYNATLPAPGGVISDLCLHYANGDMTIFNYSHYVKVICTSQQLLSIFFHTDVVTIEGRNLGQVARDLYHRKIGELFEFFAGQHSPPDPDDPLITDMWTISVQEAMQRGYG